MHRVQPRTVVVEKRTPAPLLFISFGLLILSICLIFVLFLIVVLGNQIFCPLN